MQESAGVSTDWVIKNKILEVWSWHFLVLSDNSADPSQPALNRNVKSGTPIVGLDVISLDHPELQGELSSDIIYREDTPEVYFRGYKGKYPLEYRSLNSLWQIEHLNHMNQGSIFDALEYNEHVLSSNLTTNHFRLRHFLTGRLMIVRTTPHRDGKSYNKILLKREVPDKAKQGSQEVNTGGNSTHNTSGISIGGLEQVPSEEDEGLERKHHKFNFEFVIMEEKFLRNKCLVYLQSYSKF